MYLIALLTITAILTGQSEAQECEPDVWAVDVTFGNMTCKPDFKEDCGCVDENDISLYIECACGLGTTSINIANQMESGQDITVAALIRCLEGDCEDDESYYFKSYGYALMDGNWTLLSKSSDKCTFNEENGHTCTHAITLPNLAELSDYFNIKKVCFWAYLKSQDDSTSKAYATLADLQSI